MPSPAPTNPNRQLNADEERVIAAAREKCFLLYEGKVTPHRSCGIALAETFNVATPAYQSLRKGGITGCGECGSIMAGRLILGELLGDPNPTGTVTSALRHAMQSYEKIWPHLIERGKASDSNIICNNLTGQFSNFKGPQRAGFCGRLAAQAAAACAEALIRHGFVLKITAIDNAPNFDPDHPNELRPFT